MGLLGLTPIYIFDNSKLDHKKAHLSSLINFSKNILKQSGARLTEAPHVCIGFHPAVI
jgi:hypothetical protein